MVSRIGWHKQVDYAVAIMMVVMWLRRVDVSDFNDPWLLLFKVVKVVATTAAAAAAKKARESGACAHDESEETQNYL